MPRMRRADFGITRGNNLEKGKKKHKSATSLLKGVRHVGKKRHPETKGGMTRRPGRSKSFLSPGEDFETALLCFCVFDYFWVEIILIERDWEANWDFERRKFPLVRWSLKKGGRGGDLRVEGQSSSAQSAKSPPPSPQHRRGGSPTLVEEEEACSVGRGHVLRHVADLQVVDEPSEKEQEACRGGQECSVYSRRGGGIFWRMSV